MPSLISWNLPSFTVESALSPPCSRSDPPLSRQGAVLAHLDSLPSHDLVLWTDGSVPFPFGKGGSGVLANCSLCGNETTLSFSAGLICSSFSAEACAILQVLCWSRHVGKFILKSRFHRGLAICSKSTLQNELSNIRSILTNNGYPEAVIKAVITKKINQFHRPTQFGPKKCPVYLHLPWLGNVSMRYEMQIKTAVKRCYFAVEPCIVYTTRQLLSVAKKGCTTRFSSKQHCLPISVPLR